LGYRAPSFSITPWAIEIIKESGYVYDSSLMPATLSLNRRYGRLTSSHFVGGTKRPNKPDKEVIDVLTLKM
jgi:hypothetical protein